MARFHCTQVTGTTGHPRGNSSRLQTVLKSGTSQTTVRVPKPLTAKGDGARRTPQVWQVTLVPPGRVMEMPTSALGAAHAARISPAPVQRTNLSPASSPTEATGWPLVARKPHQVGNRNPHVSPNARFPTWTRHLHPRGLHPSWGAQQPAAQPWLKLSEAVLQAQSIPLTARLCGGPARVPPAVSLQDTLLQAREGSSRGGPIPAGLQLSKQSHHSGGRAAAEHPEGSGPGRQDGTPLRGSKCAHGTMGSSWGRCSRALPTVSSPLMYDGVPASEDVFENISSTDTNCYSSHPRVSSPAQLPLNVTQSLHFSTD